MEAFKSFLTAILAVTWEVHKTTSSNMIHTQKKQKQDYNLWLKLYRNMFKSMKNYRQRMSYSQVTSSSAKPLG